MSKYDEIQLLDNATLATLTLADSSKFESIVLESVSGRSKSTPIVAPAIGGSTGTIAELKGITAWALMLDAIAGMTLSGGNINTLTDQSGNNVTVSLPDGAIPATLTSWRTSQPAWQFVAATKHRIQIGGDASWTVLTTPFTVVTVMDAFSDDGIHDANIYRDNTAIHSVGYIDRAGGTGKWGLYNGTVFLSTFTTVNRAGPNIRIDVTNAATSAIWANGTKQTGDSGNTAVNLGTFYIGSNTANNAPINAIMPFFGVITHAISDVEGAAIVNLLRARYTQIPAI